MTRLCALVVAVAASSTLLAQSAPTQDRSQTTFRAGTNYIRVDMHASLDGRPVTDLTAGEVELLEDGVPQAIETFEHVAVRDPNDPAPRVEPSTVADSRASARESRARVFVIFLDTYHTQDEGVAIVRTPLVRFLDRLLGPDDLVAVMTPEMRPADLTFSRKTDVIGGIVRDEWWGRRGRGTGTDEDPKEQIYRACYGARSDARDMLVEMRDRRRERLTLDAVEELVVHLGTIREERKAVVTVTEGWRLYSENQQLARPLEALSLPATTSDQLRGGQGNVRGGGLSADLRECEADRVSLALMNSTRRVRDIAEAANRANVSFYPVYARGLTSTDAPIGPDRPPTPAEDRANLSARQSNLRELAENTDGLAIVNTNQIDAGLTRIIADLSSYYLLSYYSTNTRLDGRFRTISVRVKRPGVQVRARPGYRGLTAEEVAAASERGVNASAATATAPISVALNPRAQFRTRASTWTVMDADAPRAQVWLVGEIDYTARRELAWSDGGTADVIVVAADGMEVASTEVQIPAADGAFTLRLPPVTGVGPGEYAVRVRVRPTADPTLPVTDTVRLIVSSASSLLGEPVIWRRGPSTGPRHLATADPRFRRNERIRMELPTTAPGAPVARMIDKRGNPMQVPVQINERADASGAFRWIVVDAPLAPLAIGEYGISVSLGDSRQVGVFQIVP